MNEEAISMMRDLEALLMRCINARIGDIAQHTAVISPFQIEAAKILVELLKIEKDLK